MTVALVTGSSRGIGKATALKLASEGIAVVVNYSTSEKEALDVVNDIKQQGGLAQALHADISSEQDVEHMVRSIVEEFGSIDMLVNNAGIVHDIPLLDKSVEQWRQTLEVNLLGTFLCTRAVAQHMLANKSGSIVNVSSTNAINCFSPEAADYDASKAGVITLTKNFAKELAPHIRVNCVAPGWVDTDMNADLPGDFIDEEKSNIYLGRFARPEEIAECICFLLSEKASFVNGSIFVADGGY